MTWDDLEAGDVLIDDDEWPGEPDYMLVRRAGDYFTWMTLNTGKVQTDRIVTDKEIPGYFDVLRGGLIINEPRYPISLGE